VTGHNATRKDFDEIFGKAGDTRGELQDLIKDTRAREVIVYFSGQALTLNGGRDVVLLPSDADAGKPDTGVRLSSLYNALARMGVTHLRLYLDAPFKNGDDVERVHVAPKIGPAGLLTPRNWVTLSAAGDTFKPGKTKRPRSVFRDSLATGLRGIADTTGDGDGTVTAQELYDFARGQAEEAAKRGEKAPTPAFHGVPGETLRAY